MRKNFILFKNNHGSSLVEMVVSMSIFVTIITMIVGFLIILYRLQVSYQETANLQQEGRVVSEIFSRRLREARQLEMSGDSINICPASSFDYDEVSGVSKNQIKIWASNSSYIAVACHVDSSNEIRSIKIQTDGIVTADSPSLTSELVSIDSFTIERDKQVTYPKSVKYNIKLVKTYPTGPINAPGLGEKIFFSGFINMRSAL